MEEEAFTKTPCRIAIASKHGSVCALLRNIVLEAGAEIAGEAASVSELLDLLKNSLADLVLIDIGLLKKRQWKTITQIKDRFPKTRILLFQKSRTHVRLALPDGVDGFFSIEHAHAGLHAAIERAQLKRLTPPPKTGR